MDTDQIRTWAEINLSHLAHNYSAIQSALPEGCSVMGVVKANAYGHGALPVAKRLAELGCLMLAVACLQEARELRRGGISTPILVLGPTAPEQALEAAELDAALSLSDLAAARALSELLHDRGECLKIHVELDTGMGRTGFNAVSGDPAAEIAELLTLPGLLAEGVFTHFAVSDVRGDPFTAAQFERFIRKTDEIEARSGRHFKLRHCANSGAVVNYRKEMGLSMVRPGIALYGAAVDPLDGGLDLRPVMTLKSRVAAVMRHAAGESVSYGRTVILNRDSSVAVLPVGYADGLHRVLSNKMRVCFDGNWAPQIGRICMDMCMADVTELPGVKTGDVAVLFGEGGIGAEEAAALAGTIPYEIFCAVSPRVPRVYIGE